MTDSVIVEADGGSRGNPGPAGYGAVVFDAATGAVLAERSEAIGTATNNVAEYRGLLAGLSAAHELGARRVAVRMDSKLVVEQMKGTWQVKNPALRELAHDAASLRSEFADVSFEWIPRERNKYADRLANEAMDKAAGRAPRRATPDRATRSTPAPPAWVPPAGPPTRLVLIRHGATEHSGAMRLSGRNDLPLDTAGREQAAVLAAGEFGQVAAVVSSPLRRAVQTAEAIAGARGLPIVLHDGFTELDFGAWEGLTMAEARARDAAGVDAWLASPEVAPPGGESFAVLERRVRRACEEVIAANPESTVVVVSHVTPIKMLIRLALDAPPSAMFRLFLDIASVTVLDYFSDGNSCVRVVNASPALSQF